MDKQPEKSYRQSRETDEAATVAPGEVVVGQVIDLDDAGRVLVAYSTPDGNTIGNALTTLPVTQKDVGRQAALLFANGDFSQPIVMGLIHSPLHDLLDTFENERAEDRDVFPELILEPTGSASEPDKTPEAEVDEDNVVIEGKKSVTLRCGDSSITLMRSGKIVLRGKYLVSRASGVNRILGGSVQVN